LEQTWYPEIVLTDLWRPMVEAWSARCGDLPRVSAVHDSIFTVGADAIVSPANSFGFMDGGIDREITASFGPHVQARLQERIRTRHHGELLVGTAEIVPTDRLPTRYVVAAPTMRVPMVLTETVNPYLATRAALLLVKHGTFDDGRPIRSDVRRIAFPGMGTGVGKALPTICARQMMAAIEAVVLERVAFPASWHDAQTAHQLLYADVAFDLQQGGPRR